jgi:putative photosynthetic complex assembly protein 2
MIEYGLPVAFALFVWWFSTGLILLLDGLPRRTFPWSMAAISALALVALWGLARTSDDASVAGAYLAFTCAVLVWAWQEMSFLTGTVTGPRKHACAPGCGGWRHFVHAIEAILWHELALIATAIVVVALTWGGANQVGTWTFMILWAMRQSAKLNLHFGVRNLSEEFLPDHLRYLKSFFSRKPMNLLFPVSVTAATVVATLLMQRALVADAGAHEIAGLMLLSALLWLAIVEHWFLVLPLPATALWNWSLRPGARQSDARAGTPVPDADDSRRASVPLPP